MATGPMIHQKEEETLLVTEEEEEEIMSSREAEGGERSYWALQAKQSGSCMASAALLYCRSDSAFLGRACDVSVHSASPHERVWLCEVCEQAPAAVTCKADAAALCVSCDADIHSANPLARRHERVPVVPFLDAPKEPSNDLLDNEGRERELQADLKSADCFFSDVDPYLDLDYASSMDAKFQQTDSVVPVQQAKSDAAALRPPLLDFNSNSYSTYSVSSSEAGVLVPDVGVGEASNGYEVGRMVMGNPVAATMDREARVMRYREKRKNRRFEKTIRYASRKAYAETRPRIKGRFAKRTDPVEVEVESEGTTHASVAAVIMMGGGYATVPSF